MNKFQYKKYVIILLGLLGGLFIGLFTFIEGLKMSCVSGPCTTSGFSLNNLFSLFILKVLLIELVIGYILYFLFSKMSKIFARYFFIVFILVIIGLNMWFGESKKLWTDEVKLMDDGSYGIY